MASTCRQRLCAFALLFIVGSTLCARLPPKKLVVADPSPEDGGVVQLIPPTHGSIVRSHKDNTVPKNSRSEPDLTTLGYVTPWNNHGYDVAKFYPKFSMISPVWIQIVPHEGRFQLKGTHDIDKGWIDDVRKASGNNVLILPRVQTHGFSPDHWIKMWTHEDYTITMITRLCLENGFDGIVLEMWDELGGYIKPHLTKVYQFFKKLRADFDKHDLKLVLVVPPPTSDESKAFFSTTNYKDLISYADYFSIMSYDYSHPYNAGPVSPLPWFSGIIETLVRASPNNRQKILMGINFYGNTIPSPLLIKFALIFHNNAIKCELNIL
eukprot:TRINITY_DN2121_c0_g1_i3.p1 TRINITY_DN2121_c0_g1~~TRINITY_DN2121_c0_g1_i3.p1  ORF type:complete len:323 (+),score=50.92 TRINITY_DN2121_c0_g1_i3:109-1077(+)